MNISQKMKQDWDRRAKIDPLYWVEPTHWETSADFFQSAIDDTNSLLEGIRDLIPSSARILDVGCGVGRMAEILSDNYREVHGVDVSNEMIQAGKKRTQGKTNLTLHETNGVDLSLFENNSFDFIYSFGTLQHLPKPIIAGYFKEIARLLKKEGFAKLQLWTGEQETPQDHDTLTFRVLTEKELHDLSKDGGLDLVSSSDHEYIDPLMKIHPVWCTFNKGKNTALSSTAKKIPFIIDPDTVIGQEENQTEADLFIYYATARINQGNKNKAKEALLAALELDPQSIDAYSLLTSLYLDENNLSMAINCLKKGVKEIPNYDDGIVCLEKLTRLQQETNYSQNSQEVRRS